MFIRKMYFRYMENKQIQDYIQSLLPEYQPIADKLFEVLSNGLPDAEAKIWHAHPVWFIDGNPVAGFSQLKGGLRLLFWSGQSFDESGLKPEGSFKAAEARYTNPDQINETDLDRWLQKARDIQWDYKNIVKRKGALEKLKGL
jgi:hypothetical protein